MANRNLELALRIRTLVEGAKNVLGLSNEVKGLRNEASKPIPDPTPEIRAGADRTADAIKGLQRNVAGLVSVAAIKQFVDNSVEEFARAEMAYRSLEAVANFTGVGIGRALQTAERLSADGLITVAESSRALQNLLSRGYDIGQAEQTLVRLKDAAAFNRAAHLGLGEAVVSASEGLKNENSILVDNAGVTKNVSVLWKEYAETIGKSVNDLTQQEKIQAEVNGILRETEAQTGNAAKALSGYQGQIAQADAEQRKFMASLGQILAPTMAGLRQLGVVLIDNVAKPMVVFFQSVGVAAAATVVNLGIVYDAVRNLDFDGVLGKLEANNEQARASIRQLGEDMRSGALDFAPLGDSAKKAASDTTEATADMAKAAKQQAKDRKESVKEQIKDAERLRDALIKAWDDSAKAERDYLAEAKKLRAEASATPRDGSQESQASAMIDLIAAEQALQRIRGSAPLEDIRAQVDLIEQLAGGIDDQARATDAMNRAKLVEAGALERAAGEEAQRQSQIAEQQKANEARLAQFQTLLKDLEAGKSVKIDLDVAEAKKQAEDIKAIIDSIKDKTITLTVKQQGSAGAPAAIPGFATGTVLPGYGGGDRRLILAEDGEAITRKESVAYYGRDFMAALNRREIPRFATGGFVERVASPVSAGGSGLQPATLNFPDMGAYNVMASPDVVAAMSAALRKAALQHGRRR